MALSTDGTGKNYTDFKRLGHPGKYQGVVQCAKNTITDFTGSNYGAGAIILHGDAIHADTSITFSGGGTINGGQLTAGELYEFSIARVATPNVGAASASVFIRNFNIR
jgi:hypothetical protein|tara:strand:+ start:1202 stop:1525 length:324 start_codon:yes stop_codon:yes gene_type:complete